ncbi:MAG: hypothetical protein KDD25_05220, partial [Bdellovibrionales bacterium]|nr:hypothetical protein [Bdellovibrionales bacterium]
MAEEKKKKKKQKKEAVVVNAPQTEVSSATQKPAEDKSKKEVNPNRAIIVANNRPFFENAAQFLDRRGFDTVVVTSLTEVIKLVSEARPKYAFISYNLKNANVKKMEVLLTKTFNLNCIVFPEELGSQVAARLQREGFAHVMQAPVSGPSMYMHIKKMIREEEDAANRKERKKRELNKDWNNHVSDRIQIKKSDLKKHFDENMHGEWSQTTDANGKTVWHFDNGSETSHNGKSGMYTFTGEKPPVRNEKGEWEIPEDGEMQFNEFNESAKSSGIYFQKGLPDQKAGGIYMPSQKSGFDDGNSLNDSENS